MNYDVIIAAYNGEKYILEQIESIMKQTITPKNIIIRNDASTDNTLTIINELQSEYPDLITVVNDGVNLGYIKNFEALVNHTTSEIVFFSDQDDIWIDNKAEKMINLLSNTGKSVVFTDAFLVNNKKEKLGTLWEFAGFNPAVDSLTFERLYVDNFATGATMAARREFLMAQLPFPATLPHDYWITVNAAIKSELVSCSEKLILYRQHDANVIGAHDTSLIHKIISMYDDKKLSRRMNYYREKHHLLIELEERGIITPEKLQIYKKNVLYINAIYNNKIMQLSNQQPRYSPISALLADEYQKYTSKKKTAHNILDAITLRLKAKH